MISLGGIGGPEMGGSSGSMIALFAVYRTYSH